MGNDSSGSGGRIKYKEELALPCNPGAAWAWLGSLAVKTRTGSWRATETPRHRRRKLKAPALTGSSEQRTPSPHHTSLPQQLAHSPLSSDGPKVTWWGCTSLFPSLFSYKLFPSTAHFPLLMWSSTMVVQVIILVHLCSAMRQLENHTFNRVASL